MCDLVEVVLVRVARALLLPVVRVAALGARVEARVSLLALPLQPVLDVAIALRHERLRRRWRAGCCASARVRAGATHLLEIALEAGASYGALCAFLGIDQGCPAATDTLPRNLAMQKPPKIAPQNHESVSSLLATARVRTSVAACKAALLAWAVHIGENAGLLHTSPPSPPSEEP